MQSSFYTHGLSAKFKINDYNTAQGVISLLGPYSSYTGRYIKGFSEKDVGSSVEVQPYVMVMGGLHTVTVSNYQGQNSVTSSSFGYGIGGGIAWKFSSFENFEISNEIACTNVATALTGYNWSYIHYGFGLHYYIGN